MLQSWVAQLMLSCFLINRFERIWNLLSYLSVEQRVILNHYLNYWQCQWSCDKFTGEYWFWGKIWTALPLNLRTELYQGPQVLFKQNRLCIILVTFHLHLTKLWLFGNVMCPQVGNFFFSMIPPIWSIILSREIFWKSAEP